MDLESNLPQGMLEGAASVAVLRQELKRLNGDYNDLSKASVQSTKVTQAANKELDKTAASSKRADQSINQLTGRLRLFADVAALLGPALVPLGGVGLAGVAGLSAQLGFAAVGAGVLIGSLQGLGDALGALNDAHLEPTAENLAEAETQLSKLSPAAASFAREAYGLVPVLKQIRDSGAEGLFPGLTDSLDDLERLAPVVMNIFSQVGTALGDIASGGAASLASDRWTGFFDFIATEAPRALAELASTVGSLTHGLAELWMAFTPLNQDASAWMMDAADSFDRWAQGLAQTQGFQDFVEYIRTTGPQVADTLGAISNMFVQIITAAAPLGGPTLAALEAVADAFSLIAGSDVGTALLTAASAMALFNRSGMLIEGTQKRIASTSLTMNQSLARGAAGMAGLAIASTGAGDSLGVTNTASLALMGTMISPGFGTAFGAAVGAMLDMNAATAQAEAQLAAFKTSLESMSFNELLSGLNEAQALLSVVDEDSLAGSVISSRVDALQDEVEVRKELAAEQQRLAGQSAYRQELEAENSALAKNIGLMQAKRDEALRSFSAETNYAQALLDAKKALEENGRVWNKTTEAGLANRRIVEQQASAWNELNRTQGQTPEQARKARKALIDTAESLGATKKQARDYARELLDIPNDLKTRIALDIDTATQRAKAIKAELASIDRNIDVYVNVRRPNASGFGPQVGSYYTGGFTGEGGKHEPAGIVHRGEIVLPTEVVNADWTFLRSRYGYLPGFADGGVVGKSGKKPSKQGAHFEEAMTAVVGPGGIRDMLQAAEIQAQAARDQEEAARIGALAAKDQLDAAQATADAAEQSLRAAEQMQESFRDSVSGQFSSSLTGGGLAGLVQNVSRDTNAGASMDATLQALVAAGLDPTSALYRELAQSEDLKTANELLASGSSYIASVQQQVSDRNQVNVSRGTTSADQSFGQMVSEQQAAYSLAQAQLAQQQAQYSAQAAQHAQTSAQLSGLEDAVRNLAGQLADALNSTVRGGRR